MMEGITVYLINEEERNQTVLEIQLNKDAQQWMVEGFQQLHTESL
ncbi:hypothetical protein [Alkalihalobacillus pseudalcaliphilus]|nr:hypothetical protein [Alkalihalobacillus pseudalcaliphilus]